MHSHSTRLRAIGAIAASITLIAACGNDEPPVGTDTTTTTAATATTTTTTTQPIVEPGLTVAEALLEPDGSTVNVDGFLVATEGQGVLLAEALAESYPPQAGGATLMVEGLDPKSIAGAITDMGVTWTDGAIQLSGKISAGVLTVGD